MDWDGIVYMSAICFLIGFLGVLVGTLLGRW